MPLPNRTIKALIVSIFVFLGGTTRAAQVLSIDKTSHTAVVTQRSTGDWRMDEGLCILHEWKEVACGKVIETGTDTVKLRLKSGSDLVAVGDFVQAAPTTKPGQIVSATTVQLPQNVRLLRIYPQRLSATLEAGPNYVFPGVQYQVALDRLTCLGITGGYWSLSPSQATLSGAGGIVSLSFYQQRCYQGLWMSLDLGAYFLKATGAGTTETVNTVAGGASGGFDARLSDRITLRLAGGARFLTHPHAATVSYDLDPWIYFFSGAFGWKF